MPWVCGASFLSSFLTSFLSIFRSSFLSLTGPAGSACPGPVA